LTKNAYVIMVSFRATWIYDPLHYIVELKANLNYII
jgi:hypothetical protein